MTKIVLFFTHLRIPHYPPHRTYPSFATVFASMKGGNPALKAIRKTADVLVKVIEHILWVLLTAAVICVVLQVFSRYVLGNSFTWTEQVARYMFIWMVMLGVPVAFHRKIFLNFDMIQNALPKKAQFVLDIFIKVGTMAFASYYFVASLQLVIQTWGRTTSGVKVPFWALYGAQPVFCVLLFIVMGALLCETIQDRNKPAEEAKEEIEA